MEKKDGAKVKETTSGMNRMWITVLYMCMGSSSFFSTAVLSGIFFANTLKRNPIRKWADFFNITLFMRVRFRLENLTFQQI